MTWIPGGTFTSGDTVYTTNYTSNIAGFLLDTAPVTMSAYATCVQNGYCTTNSGGGDNCNGLYDSSRSNNPANCVSYQQAYWYCNSVGKRLPTEWEFEYAGRYPDRRIWPWGNTEPGANTICWAYPTFDSRATLGTCPVGQRPGTSSLGLIDMVGNVGVWTDSWYCTTPPCSSGITRVIRGNGYTSFESTAVRLAGQNTQFPDYAADWVGIRCAKSP
jgi:formylglycine-generating enzyme required for sulfatase activity